VERTYEQNVSTGEFNRMLKSVMSVFPCRLQGKNIKIIMGHRWATAPPSFVLFTNAPKEITRTLPEIFGA